jgi:hypothetical protein
MSYVYKLKMLIAGTLLWAGVVVAGVGLSAGTAHATKGPFTWCPGQSMQWPSGPDDPRNVAIGERYVWDMHACHTWYVVADGWGNVPHTEAGQPTLHDSNVWDGNNPPPDNPGHVNCGLMFCPNPGGTPPGWHG